MKISITIIDDNQRDIDSIKSVLQSFNNSDHILFINEYISFDYCKNFDSDLYILDIDMPGEDGFHVAQKIEKQNPTSKIVFCTSHHELVFNAFELNTFYYVRKDELKSDLTKAMRKFYETYDNRCYVFASKHIPSKILLDHIIYFQADGNNVLIKTTENGENYTDRCSLRTIMLSSLPDSFIRVSGAFILNLKYVNSLDGQKVFLKDGSHIEISRDRIKEFKLSWNEYLLRAL